MPTSARHRPRPAPCHVRTAGGRLRAAAFAVAAMALAAVGVAAPAAPVGVTRSPADAAHDAAPPSRVATNATPRAAPADRRPRASMTPDEQFDAEFARHPPPQAMVAPAPAEGTVVPSRVARWREEAKALEHGDAGTPRDPARAATLYCQAARHGDAEAQFNLAWMLTNARGVERDEAAAAHLFAAAAEQQLPQAVAMAQRLGTPLGDPPVCLREPGADEPPASAAAPPVAAQAPQAALDTRRWSVLPWLRPPVTTALRHRLYDEAPPSIVSFVRRIAPEYGIVPQYALAIMAAESAFNPLARSHADAHGLMQLIPATAARFGVRNVMDPAQNIRGGMAYLRWLLAYFEGDLTLVTAAYNAGEGAVDRYRGVPPYAETRVYVRRVLGLMGEGTKHPFQRHITDASPQMPRIRALAPNGVMIPGYAFR